MSAAYPKISRTIYYGQPVNWQHPVNRGLLGWWLALPQLRGGVALQDLVAGRHATLTNGAFWAGASRNGGYGSIETDGTNDYALAASSATLSDATRPMSACCWVQRLATGVRTYLWGHRSRWAFYFHSTDVLRVVFFGVAEFGSTGTVTDTKWHHAAFTMDSAGATTFYIDGLAVGTGTMSSDGSTGAANAMEIGSWTADGVYSAQRQDDIRFYRRALSAGEVATICGEGRYGQQSTLNWLSRSAWFVPGAAAPATDSVGLVGPGLCGYSPLVSCGGLA